MSKVVMTGSLGNIGQYLAKLLVENGHSVTVVTSSEDRRKDIEALGARAAVGAVEDVSFLTATFKGNEIAFIVIPPSHTAPNFRARYQAIAKNYVQAIKDSGIKRVIDLSSIGAHQDHGFGLLNCFKDIEQEYENISGASVVHIRPTYFYTNLERMFGTVAANGLFIANYGNIKIPLVHPKDIAKVALKEIEAKPSGNKVIYVTSDERTGEEIAEVLGKSISRPELKWLVCTDDQAKNAMLGMGLNEDNANQYTEMGKSMGDGSIFVHHDQNKPEFGKIKLEEYAKEWAAGYAKFTSK